MAPYMIFVLLYKNEGSASDSGGFLSSLLGAGCECEGYDIRIVGHSLGGAISALLGLRVRAYHIIFNFFFFGIICLLFGLSLANYLIFCITTSARVVL